VRTRHAALLLSLFLIQVRSADAKTLIVDTFDKGIPQNELGGGASAWGDESDKTISCTVSFDPVVRRGDSGAGLRLDYDIQSDRENVYIPTNRSLASPEVVRDEVYNGYYSLFKTPVDLRPYKYLVLWAKGDASRGYTRSFRIELKDGKTSASVLLDGITEEWQQFSIPLASFKELDRWEAVTEFTIVFIPTAVTRKVGTIYLDDFYFSVKPDEDLREQRKLYPAVRAKESPAIDGLLAEWPGSSFVNLSSDPDYLEKGQVSGRNDFGVQYAVSWDERFLYVAVDVKDNEMVNEQAGPDIWKDDCIELYLDAQNQGFEWGNPRNYQLGFAPVSSSGESARYAWFQNKEPDPSETASQTMWHSKGYKTEMAISWGFLGVSPSVGMKMGFSLAVHDRDKSDDTEEAKLNWSFKPSKGPRIELGQIVLK